MGTEQVYHAGSLRSVLAISASQHQMKPWKCDFCGLLDANVKGKDCPCLERKVINVINGITLQLFVNPRVTDLVNRNQER